MAKSKSFFGLRTGSTKSLTFQVYRGQQITKDRVTRISNPRSEAQMKQRALIPIVAASRAALRGLVDHSFEGVAYGEQSLKMFSSLNLKSGALDVKSYSPNGFTNPGFATLQISAGSLINRISSRGISEDKTKAVVEYSGAGDLKFPAAAVGDDADAILNAIATWGATNNVAEVSPGNQLTFLTVSNVDITMVGNKEAPLSAFDINRVLFPSAETTSSQDEDVNGPWKVSSQVSQGATKATLYNKKCTLDISFVGGQLIFEVEPTNNPSGSTVVGIGVIRSANVNGTWKRSTEKIWLEPMGADAYTYEMWRSYYQSTSVSAKYLNHGDESTGIA